MLTLNGMVVRSTGRGGPRRTGSAAVEPDQVARYIAQHPGSRAEDIAAALGTGSVQLRPALMKLRSLGAVAPKGKARATRYYASAS